ncbi:MAG: glycosyltransferase family 2 protein [Halanaeroarchaeum sp.]
MSCSAVTRISFTTACRGYTRDGSPQTTTGSLRRVTLGPSEDADFIQFTEKPIYTGSRLTYLCDVFRTGHQFEQLGFHRLSYPLYAWGGGFAIRHEIEHELGWDVTTITEDTNLIWRAAKEYDLTYRLVNERFRNQAPPSLQSMFKQRRRLMSGTVKRRPSSPGIIPASLLHSRYCVGILSVRTATGSRVVSVAGYRAGYRSVQAHFDCLTRYPVRLHVPRSNCVSETPDTLAHLPVSDSDSRCTPCGRCTVGGGVVRPVEEFEVTEKVTAETIEELNRSLERVNYRTATGRTVAP